MGITLLHFILIFRLSKKVIVNLAKSSFADYLVVDATDDFNFGTYMESFVHISLRRAAISCDKLVKCWGKCLQHQHIFDMIPIQFFSQLQTPNGVVHRKKKNMCFLNYFLIVL